MKKLIFGWIAVKSSAFILIWLLFAYGTAQTSKPKQAPTPTPTPSPAVDTSVNRPTSDPYTGDLARFDRENRAEKLQIERVMDTLGIKEDSRVADIGAGGGWFTAIASKRVGESGKVYAVDISQASVDYIENRKKKESLSNIETVLATFDDPKLNKDSVDAVLILNTYHEIAEPVKYLRNLFPAMSKGGLLGVIDREGSGGDHGVDQSFVKDEAKRAGFEFVEEYDFVNKDRMDYFLVFKKQ
ncbi:MAG: methyltransferase domain-containing protein [Pyrinomonadaceae bacterium]|nr:methyltransferase domain-containing protein [Pyrinomonadaceae bacterium]